MRSWPLQRDCDAFYGNPRGRGGSVVSPSWYQRHIAFVRTPWKSAMGEIKITRIAVHARCAAAFEAWFDAVWANAGRSQREIDLWGMSRFGGAFNYRPMRGGSALSMHAYGAAIDFDPQRNGLGNRRPHFRNLREEVVQPFLRLGGVWGGDWNGNGDTLDERRCDGMHFQFARLR
jgi:hypothetical protein